MILKEFLTMAGNEFYNTGKGMYGGPGGTYGRYGIGKMASNLSNQFQKSESAENTQRRRFKRKRESGFVGEGYHFANYPNMIGAMSAGTDPREGSMKPRKKPMSKGKTASTRDTMGIGGVTFNGSNGGVS